MSEGMSMPGLAHAVFLERAAQEEDSARARFGQAAFLVLRLVDLVPKPSGAAESDDLFGYQAAATTRYCAEQLPAGAAREQLLRVVVSATQAHQRNAPATLGPALLTFAAFLVDHAEHESALDVLTTLDRSAGDRLAPREAIDAALMRGRIERELARFDVAIRHYERAAALADAAHDTRSVLLSRLGRANVCWGRGNLVEAEQWTRSALREAEVAGERDAQARAEHGLGVVLGARGQLPDAVPHLWRAYELYQDEKRALRVMQDLGHAMARLGAIMSAERAFKIVLQKEDRSANAHNTLVELMHCASFRRDRLAFERWRAACDAAIALMTPNTLTDFHLKAGIGLARFEQLDRAQAELDVALELARAHGLHEFQFRIERISSGLRTGTCSEESVRESIPDTPAWAAALGEVSAALAEVQPA